MKIIAVNGSPRESWNTGTLLKAALKYAEEQGHETEFVQLSGLNYRGCRSCLACKLDKEPWTTSAECAVKDELTPVMDKIKAADIFLVGSPIYYGSLSADTYGFFERLWFSASRYDAEHPSKLNKRIPNGLIVTMNVTRTENYKPMLENILLCQKLIGPSKLLAVGDTCQFDNYDNYVCRVFDGAHKETRKITEDSEDYCRARQFMQELIDLKESR